MGKIRRLMKKVITLYRDKGLDGVMQRIEAEGQKIDIYNFYGFTVNREIIPLNEAEKKEVGDTIVVNWVIPDIGVGSGGHLNIFRFIANLEDMGLHNRIYLYESRKFQNDEEFRAFLKEYYGTTLHNENIESYNDVVGMKYAHATIATGWQTANYVRRFENTLTKFYFVQDFEPFFYPMGSEYLLAENTYKYGFRGITAGDWLKNKLHDEYGMETDSFHFSYDKDIYQKHEKRDDKKRVFFYARPVTPRRAFELGLLTLIELHKRVPELEVIFAGWDVSNYEIPFIHLNAGSLKLEELPDLYAQCDMCLVMSTTNLSLLPLEIMASNSVVVCPRGKNNEWMLNEENSIQVSYDPVEIADTMAYYFDHPEELQIKRDNGLEFVKHTSWEQEAKKVYDIILKGIREDGK